MKINIFLIAAILLSCIISPIHSNAYTPRLNIDISERQTAFISQKTGFNLPQTKDQDYSNIHVDTRKTQELTKFTKLTESASEMAEIANCSMWKHRYGFSYCIYADFENDQFRIYIFQYNKVNTETQEPKYSLKKFDLSIKEKPVLKAEDFGPNGLIDFEIDHSQYVSANYSDIWTFHLLTDSKEPDENYLSINAIGIYVLYTKEVEIVKTQYYFVKKFTLTKRDKVKNFRVKSVGTFGYTVNFLIYNQTSKISSNQSYRT